MSARLRTSSTALSAVAVGVELLAIGEARGRATVTISCGMTVTTSIVAGNDLVDCPAGEGLVVGAPKITIDLNGHTIDQDAAFSGIGVLNHGFDGVKLVNGRI